MTIKYFDKAISLNKISHTFGFKWKDIDQILEKIDSEMLEVKEAFLSKEGEHRVTEEMGDLMFAVVSLSYFVKIDPEQAFIYGINKYEKRFKTVLKILEEKNISLDDNHSSELLYKVWEEAKLRTGAAGED